MVTKFLKTKFYPVDLAAKIIYNDPKDTAKAAEWVEPYRSANVLAVKGSRLMSYSAYHKFEVRAALSTATEPATDAASDPLTISQRLLLEAIKLDSMPSVFVAFLDPTVEEDLSALENRGYVLHDVHLCKYCVTDAGRAALKAVK